MIILLAVLLSATVILWIVYPFFMKEPARSEEETTGIHEEIEKEIEVLRQEPATKNEGP